MCLEGEEWTDLGDWRLSIGGKVYRFLPVILSPFGFCNVEDALKHCTNATACEDGTIAKPYIYDMLSEIAANDGKIDMEFCTEAGEQRQVNIFEMLDITR